MEISRKGDHGSIVDAEAHSREIERDAALPGFIPHPRSEKAVRCHASGNHDFVHTCFGGRLHGPVNERVHDRSLEARCHVLDVETRVDAFVLAHEQGDMVPDRGLEPAEAEVVAFEMASRN